jgi:hypothetical protein
LKVLARLPVEHFDLRGARVIGRGIQGYSSQQSAEWLDAGGLVSGDAFWPGQRSLLRRNML